MLYQVIDIINDLPTFEVPWLDILKSLKRGGAIKILTPAEYHTERQRKWYKGICLKGLSDWSGETKEWWDAKLKNECFGDKLLKREKWFDEDGIIRSRLTIKGVGKKNMTAFIENILSKAIEMDWPVTPPDPDLRS